MDKPKTAPVIHERPKMPRATWEALRTHIIKERRRKQEEEGKAEEYERLKKERESKKQMEASSLDETKKQIAQLEEKLTALKDEKHQLFLTLKKVLNEDETRRRKENIDQNSLYPPHGAPVFPLTGHMAQNNSQLAAMYLQPHPRQPAMYLKPHNLPPALPPGGSIKRQRTPSPPRQQLSSGHYRSVPSTAHSRSYHPAGAITSAPYHHFPGSSGGREEERKQPVYLSHQARYGGSVEAKSDRDSRARLSVAPPAHVQPIALTTTRAGNFSSGYPVPSLALASSSLPPRLAYTQSAAAAAAQQLQVAQQLAAQQAAAQAAAGGPPTTRYYTGSLHGREV